VIDWLSPLSLAGYPFILPNLFLSMLAATQAPIIMMSPRQDAKNRVRSQLDYEVKPPRGGGHSRAGV
jgi:uncharacterized membrane protein